MSDGDYARSFLFPDHQDVDLAREAAQLRKAFKDTKFLRIAANGSSPLPEISYIRQDTKLRAALDSVLVGYQYTPDFDKDEPRPIEEIRRLAGRVEAFVTFSPAIECRTMQTQAAGKQSKYVIAISGFAVDLMAQIAYAAPFLIDYYDARSDMQQDVLSELFQAKKRGHYTREQSRFLAGLDAVGVVDKCVRSYIRSRDTEGAEIPVDMVGRLEHGPDEQKAASGEIYHACAAFLLAHELHHIEGGHFFEDYPLARGFSFIDHMDPEQRRETEADCAAFTITLNSMITSLDDGQGKTYTPDFGQLRKYRRYGRTRILPGPRRRQQRALFDRQLLRNSLHKAACAMLSFYAAKEILAATAQRDGRTEEAGQLSGIIERRNAVRLYADVLIKQMMRVWGMEREFWEFRSNVIFGLPDWNHMDSYVRDFVS
ncbi:hypothetical protein ACWF9B_24635 [Streptomyces sp. NPDC055089]